MTYPYILPPLPYAPAALEPNLGRSSVRLHHDAFFAAYVDRLNGALVPWTQYQDWPLERLLQKLAEQGMALYADGRWRLTAKGFLLSNQIIGALLDAQQTAASLGKRI